jgi:hypothetical protein
MEPERMVALRFIHVGVEGDQPGMTSAEDCRRLADDCVALAQQCENPADG